MTATADAGHAARLTGPDPSGVTDRRARPAQPGLLAGLARNPGFLAVLAVAVGWVAFAPNYYIFVVSSGLVLSISSLGLGVLVGWAKEITLAQAAFVGCGVYVAGWLYRPDPAGRGWPFWLAVLAAMAFVGAISVAVSLVAVRLSGIYVMVLTIGVQYTIERVVFSRGFLTGGITPLETPRPWFFGLDLGNDTAFYYWLLGLVLVVLLLMARLRRSRYGRSLLFIGSNRRAAAAVGINPWRYKMFAFGLTGLLAGLSGALAAPLFGSPPNYFNYYIDTSLAYLAIPILAGFESLLAVVAITLVFQILPIALEGVNVSAPLLGGIGLVVGTSLGARGLGGEILDRVRAFRRRTWRSEGEDERLAADRAVASQIDGSGRSIEVAYVGAGDEDPDDQSAAAVRRRRALAVLEEFLPPRPTGDVALTATGISIAFGGVQALREVDIVVPNGAFVGLIGPNGAGKSTLFDVVNGLKRPNAGTVTLFGRDVTAARAWDRAAMGMSRTFQANRINLDITVAENLLSGAHTMIRTTLAGTLAGVPSAWAAQRRAEDAAWAVAELLDIERHWDELPGALSFGNRRRVEIGRTLLAGPRLLLLDEPAAGLDPNAAGIFFALVKKLHQDLGLTVLLVEHYVKAVLRTCDLVYVLSRGELVASGTPAEVASHPDVRSQYLGWEFDYSTLNTGVAGTTSQTLS